MVPVIVAQDEVSKAAVEQLGWERISTGSLARKLQVYCVQVPPKARDLLIRNGHVRFERPDLRGDQFAVLQTASLYQEDVGLLWEDAGYLGIENSIIG
jgi:CRISPR-associated endonuclease/helicase Cas3